MKFTNFDFDVYGNKLDSVVKARMVYTWKISTFSKIFRNSSFNSVSELIDHRSPSLESK